MTAHYWTFSEWIEHTSNKIAIASVSIASEEDRVAYLKVQATVAMEQATRHGRSGLSEDDPITP